MEKHFLSFDFQTTLDQQIQVLTREPEHSAEKPMRWPQVVRLLLLACLVDPESPVGPEPHVGDRLQQCLEVGQGDVANRHVSEARLNPVFPGVLPELARARDDLALQLPGLSDLRSVAERKIVGERRASRAK